MTNSIKSTGLTVPVPHVEFDPKAFIGGDGASQDLCDFILALSLAYNDFRYYIILFNSHIKAVPKGPVKRNSQWGEYEGVKLHILRLLMAFTNELFILIDDNKNVLDDRIFDEIKRKMNRKSRESLQLLIEATFNYKGIKRKSNPLYMIRNKLIFHYDKKEIFSGYKAGFIETDNSQMACISIGNKLEESRFYYSDLAIQKYIEKRTGKKIDPFIKELKLHLVNVNLALFYLCRNFIVERGYAWREPSE